MFTATQLVSHFIGDYILQTHEMATKKTSSIAWATIHAIFYTIPFVFITQSFSSLFVIYVTHKYIDRYRLARWVNYAKNINSFREPIPDSIHFESITNPNTSTGYPEGTPDWLAVWLLIITDNIMHIVINALAIYHLG